MADNIFHVFSEIIEKLESKNIDYMIVGSVASMIYGEPRMTRDMDLVIDLVEDAVGCFEDLFSSQEYYCPPGEVLLQELSQRGQFNLIHNASGLKIDIVVRKNSAHARQEFSRRKQRPFLGWF